jgi:hypothetical protein
MAPVTNVRQHYSSALIGESFLIFTVYTIETKI